MIKWATTTALSARTEHAGNAPDGPPCALRRPCGPHPHRSHRYRHGIYFHSRSQEREARAFLAKQQATLKLPFGRSIVTECMAAAVFWPAEEHHQQYLQKGGRFGSGQSAAKDCRDPVRCYG